LLRYPAAFTLVLSLNQTKEPFQDKKVREAFAYAFDRAAYCREVQQATCVPTLTWIPEGVPGHIETDAYAFDPEKARSALAESSYGGPEQLPEITWYYPTEDPTAQQIAEWLAKQYDAVLGVELTLAPTEAEALDAMFYVDAATWPQLAFSGWTQDYPDPQNWLSIYWTCGSTIYAGFVGYCNPEFDDLVARADAEPDSAVRLALYEEAGGLLVADAPAVFLLNGTNVALVKPGVTGYVTTPRDLWPGWASPLTLDVAPAAVGSAT
jgi:oligopeptide transport system substrate-binding protein